MSSSTASDDVQRAVVDRLTDGWAVLLVGDREEERRVRVDDLPDDVREGSIVQVRVSGLKIEVLEADAPAADAKRAEVKGRIARLKKSRSTGRFSSENLRPD